MKVKTDILRCLPMPLQTLCMKSENDNLIGIVFRALGGQDVDLDIGQQQIVKTFVAYHNQKKGCRNGKA